VVGLPSVGGRLLAGLPPRGAPSAYNAPSPIGAPSPWWGASGFGSSSSTDPPHAAGPAHTPITTRVIRSTRAARRLLVGTLCRVSRGAFMFKPFAEGSEWKKPTRAAAPQAHPQTTRLSLAPTRCRGQTVLHSAHLPRIAGARAAALQRRCRAGIPLRSAGL